MSPDEIVFVDLGLVEYGICHKLMLTLVEQRIMQKVGDVVLMPEHPHVYTLGRRGREENVFDKTVPLFWVERGGDVTYHGPGQFIAYPIVDLNSLGLGVADFVHVIEQAVINLLADYGIQASRREKYPGVWVAGKKIASIGLAVKQWVTYHGVALNVNTDLTKFKGIRPCGMDAEIMTSMAEILGAETNLSSVKKKFAHNLAKLLGKRPAFSETHSWWMLAEGRPI